MVVPLPSASLGRSGSAGHSAAMLALACLAFCTTGCHTTSDQRVEVVFIALGAEGEHVAALMPEFERRNPGIRVRVHMPVNRFPI
jgi:multiple sugar transport system substrate-binding protein